jgi:serine/threonine protein kinase
MQRYIRKHIDRKIFYVPKVLRFITNNKRGYIVMEFIKGKTLDEYLADTNSPETAEIEVVQRIARAIAYLSQIPLPELWVPGPLDSGIPQGYIFADEGAGRRSSQ